MNNDTLSKFQLKQIKAAKVSEISEATVSSPIPPEDRVNFHIGNPVQEERLYSAYLRMALGLNIKDEKITTEHIEEILEILGNDKGKKDKVESLIRLIKKSAPYTPRGGFIRTNPHFIINYFNEWLIKKQFEPLIYDLGDKSGRREVILSSGGIYESLRIFFHSISEYLVTLPANVFLYKVQLPEYLYQFGNLNFLKLSEEESLINSLNSLLVVNQDKPNFLLIGDITKEKTRRELRQLSLSFPLFFVELNDAPNHLSLAREAKMMSRVLRIITPSVFHKSLENIALTFILGNSDFIKVFETVHFQLKGTPSSTEIELLSFLLQNYNEFFNYIEEENDLNVEAEFEKIILKETGYNFLYKKVKQIEKRAEELINRQSQTLESIIKKYQHNVNLINNLSWKNFNKLYYDKFSDVNALELLEQLAANIYSKDFIDEIIKSYLYVFLNYHPEYKPESCLVISGSSRTALSLLGFHCGIKEVIIPDLSWTYEHCFPKVEVVPLTEDFNLDVEAIKNTVKEKLNKDSKWNKYGAVVINNPHNATGQIFEEAKLKDLIKWLLEKEIFIIDDLAYQNVTPSNDLKIIKTVRQLCDELESEGYITNEHAKYVITIHSMSKTDSFAGARLSVAEIRHDEIFSKLKNINNYIKPNIGAIFLSYLFYRNKAETIDAYYRLRNKIFKERSDALIDAVNNIPEDRNKYKIKIKAPSGSMYPQMIIEKLPPGLFLDWLSSGLARQGIGMVPLSTFARTENGFDAGRKTFRLTLGGTDSANILLKKTRRVLIDLNRLIDEESSNYSKKILNIKSIAIKKKVDFIKPAVKWISVEEKIKENIKFFYEKYASFIKNDFEIKLNYEKLIKEFLPERLLSFERRFIERLNLIQELANLTFADNGKFITEKLEKEFYKDDLQRRKEAFQKRIYDRTVHPTQMYSIKTEILFEKLIEDLIRNNKINSQLIEKLKAEIVKEYFGQNVPIVSSEEPQELLLDLNTLITVENYFYVYTDYSFNTFLSFWGDWDGSNRPSGQGHSLIAAVLIENVLRQAKIIEMLLNIDKSVNFEQSLVDEIRNLPHSNKRFSDLLNEITLLTHQLEKRYRGTLPFNVEMGRLRKLGIKLHIAQDPLTKMWRHNDRLERKMLELRRKRKETLEYYFSLNKQLRKTLHSLIPVIQKYLSIPEFFIEAGMYRDLLKRVVITPRIHQKLITSQDQFAIDTTVHNINEINEISSKYGNPGMVLAIQVSMSTKPEALISLDRKLYSRREQLLRENNNIELPNIWIIPLFEDIDSVKSLPNYLNKIWEYSLQSKRINQETYERFAEIINEVFIAGSDLSQQICQSNGMKLFKESKYELMKWLASHNLIGKVRIKLGSGEPMQRQGGYYSNVAGAPLFIKSEDSYTRLSNYLESSTKRSTYYATTPLIGVFSCKDLLTFQSNLSEKVRYLPVHDFAQLLYHVRETQKFYSEEIIRAGEPLSETRLQYKTRGLQELERLTIGKSDSIYDEFLQIYTDNFRQILYGREEDVVGIHIISYFIGRTIPALRDRPTVRPGQNSGELIGQKILERIASTIPFCRYGSLLRAIAHNQSQTMILGINQLTTGLFRALNNFSQKEFQEEETSSLIVNRILPNLPVYEMLHTLRIYQDINLKYLGKLEKAFPAGNTALIALREDIDSLNKYLLLFQKELLRRHGLEVTEFFDEDKFIPDLLPSLRPDVAVLLQPEFFNTNVEKFLSWINGNVNKKWLDEVRRLLLIPVKISEWRAKIWEFLEEPIFQRVESFVELAIALNSLQYNVPVKEILFTPKKLKVSPRLLSAVTFDDSMQQFLTAAFEYLSIISQGLTEVPINIIRALKEVESIIKIEDQPLSQHKQELLRFYLLQIARIAGENG